MATLPFARYNTCPPTPGCLLEFAVRLPAVDEPRLDLQLVGWPDLEAQTLKEPRRVRGDVRRLIGPVVEAVITPEADVRHEDAGVHVDAVERVPVIAAIAFRDVAIRRVQVPRASTRAGIIP